jgi:hypothetical protein
LADDFPALEVAAAFGALAAGIRCYQLVQARRAIPIFYLLAAFGAALAALGVALRPQLVKLVEQQSQALIEAALAVDDKMRGLGDDPCPSCGGAEAVVVDTARAFGAPAQTLGLQELRICRRCGYVQGSVSDPSRIPLGPEHGTSLSASAVIPLEEAQVEATEHEG